MMLLKTSENWKYIKVKAHACLQFKAVNTCNGKHCNTVEGHDQSYVLLTAVTGWTYIINVPEYWWMFKNYSTLL